MSSDNDALPEGNSFDDSASHPGTADDAITASVGTQLRMAREKAGMSVGDVARLLKFGPNQVQAIEADEWSFLPGKTIIRGFVRNYARLLGLDSARLMAELDSLVLPKTPELTMSSGTPVKFSQDASTDHRDTIRYISGFLILILALLAYLLVPQELWQSTMASIRDAAQSHKVTAETDQSAVVDGDESPAIVVPSVPAATTEETVDALINPLDTQRPLEPQAPNDEQTSPLLSPDPSVTENTAAEPVPVVETSVEASPPSVPPPPPPVIDPSLDFRFKQAAWVEVRDRSGKTIFSQLNQAGSQRSIVGEPPYSITIGNASQVELRYQGKTIDLSKRSKDDVARLTLE